MDVKPIPKPRSIGIERPVPAPRNVMLSSHSMQSTKRSSTSSKDSSQSEERDADPNKLGYDVCDSGSSTTSSTDFFRHLGTSSRCLRDGISEKMTVKGRAMISSTKNASIRLEKSVKNLLTRRFTSPNQDELNRDKSENVSKAEGKNDEDRCVSMPPNDIFSTISFYSPLSSNLKTAQREEDLSNVHHSPPPPVYPPPPLPDESIYDELQSVTSGSTVGSNRYDTCSSTNSDQMDRDFPSETFDLFDFVQNQASDSDQSIHTSDSRLSNEQLDESSKRLSRSESWTYREDYIPNQFESIEKLDRLSKLQDETELSRGEKTPSIVSVQNSLYENWLPQKNDPQEERLNPLSSMDSKTHTKSLLIEFDPFASVDEENIYSNYENNDLMLLESLLATNESSNRVEDIIEKHNEEDSHHEEDKSSIEIVPPEPPKRFDSLPKHEYDEVEMVERFDKTVTTMEKSPALLPKLAHLAKRKQPALPPKDHSSSCGSTFSNDNDKLRDSPKRTVNKEPIEEEPTSSPVIRNNEEYRGVSNVMQKLKKLKQDSAAHVIRPNVISLVRSRSKYLSKTRDGGGIGSITNNLTTSKNQAMKMIKPKINATQNPMTHRGIVYSRSGVNIEKMKDLNMRAAVLSDQKLSFYADKNMNTLKEVVDIETVHSIHLLQDVKMINNESVHCIALNGEGKTGVHVFYAKGPTERRIWAQRILENLTPVFPTKYTTEFTRAGWAYLKEGVTGSWFSAWLLLQQRTLVYTKTLEPATFEYIDLRKARYIVLRDQEGPSAQSAHVSMVVVDAGGKGALHIAAPGSKECSAWKYALYQAATNSGPALNQQQITQDNVPVILEKCINFIYTHGIMSEGIYRRNGSNSAVVKLLESFRRDAWATQITKDLYSEHDVATALRRFLRDLSDPLFPIHINNQLCQISKLNVEDDRVMKYRKLLLDLDPVSSATLRKILAHLHCLSQQHGRNLMTIENLSAIWGPTLMHANGNSSEEWNKFETKVVGDLIRLYPKLYQLSSADLAKEAKILQVLEKHHVSNNQIVRNGPSGDLKIWIYILSKEGECVNVTIGPQKTAFDVCCELADKACLPAHDLCLEECILAGVLERPFHHNERVLETVARWGYWDSEDRKDNILILRKDRLYKDIVPLIKPPMTMSGELKFADTKMKNFKSYLFEFSQAKLCCYKDKVYSTKLYEWKIEDVVWYLGHESKRNPHMGWSITFIVKNAKPTRCKEKPFFGNTLAGTSQVEQYKWLAAMLFGEHQMNLRPSAVNLMDP